MSKKLYLSNSSVQAFLDCKKKFKFQYIDRLKVDQRMANKYLSFGNSMHSALAAYNLLSSSEYKTLTNLHNLLRSNWIREGYESREEERSFGLKGLDMLTKYYLDKRLDSVSRRVTQIQKYNFPQKIRQYTQDFAKIFTSENEKTSLNLNAEVKAKILDLMRARFGEKGTESKLISTALLLILYQYGEQVDFKEPEE